MKEKKWKMEEMRKGGNEEREKVNEMIESEEGKKEKRREGLEA